MAATKRTTERRKKNRAADLRLQREFGITLADYLLIVKAQKGRCAICEEVPTTRRLAVDHDHKTGLVRGALCMRCNRALGKFQDITKLVVRAASYVVSPPATKALGREHFTAAGRLGTKVRKKLLNKLREESLTST